MKRFTLVHLVMGSLFVILIYGTSLNARAQTQENLFPFQPYEARYNVTWRGVDAGVSVHRLSKINPHKFYFEATTEPHLSFLPFRSLENSLFTWEKNEIKPSQFQYNMNEGKKKRIGNIQFNWTKHKIISLNTNDPFELELREHTQDKLTHLFMIRRDLQKTTNFRLPMTYTVATGDKTKNYTFEPLGVETLDTALGKIEAIKLQNTMHNDRITTIWFVKEWAYLPAKITHARNGTIITSAEISAFSQ